MNRLTTLVRTPAVSLTRFDHEPGVNHHDPDREAAEGFGVNFVETGEFSVQAGRERHRLTPDSVFVTTPGLEFSCTHDEEHPADECLSVEYSDEAIEQLRGAGATSTPPVVLTAGNRRAYLRRRLAACDSADRARLEALVGALYFTLSSASDPTSPFRAERFPWYASRVDRAKELIDASYAEPLSLTAIAREVGMSTFHFARVFRDLEGEPPHRYLTKVRLAHASARLRAGAGVTETCFAVGFGSLSHFITAFRRRYGLKPSAARHPR